MKSTAAILLCAAATVLADTPESVPAPSRFPATEADFYRVESVPYLKESLLEVSADRRSLRGALPPLVARTIYHLGAPGLKSEDGAPLLHDAAYCTLNRVPKP